MTSHRLAPVVLAIGAAVAMTAAAVPAPAAPPASAGLAIASPTASGSHPPPRRQSNAGGVAIAGASIYLVSAHSTSHFGKACSLAFAVRVAGGLGALTAGHCAVADGEPAYKVFQTHVEPHDRTSPGENLGRISAHHFRADHDGDNALIRLAHGRVSRARVFVGGVDTARWIPVVGAQAPKVGLDRLCYSGSTTGENCGYRITASGASLRFYLGKKVTMIGHEWTMTGPCAAKAGDSGSPVYVKRLREALAVGILSGGGVTKTTNPDGSTMTTCQVYFTPLHLALTEFHAHLRVVR